MSAWYWIKRIMIPVVIGASISGVIGWLPRLYMAPSFGRVIVVGLMCDTTFAMLAWFGVLDESEREFIKGRLGVLYSKLKTR